VNYETIIYEKRDRIAVVTLNRPEKYNTIRPPMPDEIEHAIGRANNDREIRVIVLQGAGKSFCGGFDFSDGLQHFETYGLSTDPKLYDPGVDMMTSFNPHAGPTQRFMSIWRSPAGGRQGPGWCVGRVRIRAARRHRIASTTRNSARRTRGCGDAT
jgi:enoyl-CoA hydratase